MRRISPLIISFRSFEIANQYHRPAACENLVGYSKAQPALFKANQLEPIKDLKLLARDYQPIAHNALTILINLSPDEEILKSLAEDDEFVEALLSRITVCDQHPSIHAHAFAAALQAPESQIRPELTPLLYVLEP